ncbi:hypothetical protein Tco_1545583, partial [Tanacetum coccineum]
IVDFEERLERIHDRGTHRVQVLDFEGMPVLMRDVLYAKMRMEHRDGDGVVVSTSQACGEEIEYLGFARYWSESERMIPGKGDLRDYWRDISTDGDFLVPPPSYTLIRDPMLRLCHMMMTHNIAGRSQAPKKSGAFISGRQFVARLAEHFGLLTEERLQGPARQKGDAGGVVEEAPMALGGGDEDEEMSQAVPPPPKTQVERIARLEEEVHGMR